MGKTVMDPIAPGLQRTISEFLRLSGWTVSAMDAKTLMASRRIGGNDWTSCFHFEDEYTISQTGSPAGFLRTLNDKAARSQSFDLIVHEKILESGQWRNYLEPELARGLSAGSNRRYGTLTEFLNRFAGEIATAFVAKVDETLKLHFIRVPVRPSFKAADDALGKCAMWVDAKDAPRLMLVTGDAGAGKSVFTLMVMRELRQRFLDAPSRYPAPFLISFTKGRPALIDDLIALTLNDLGLAYSITPAAVRLLLEQGRLVFVMDGFDEISRAMAQNAQDNIDELSKNINLRTRGKLLLTARRSFVSQEELFSDLKSSCEVEAHEEYELAPYTDSQMHEWVVSNPPDGALSPAERHWNRLESAFQHNPEIRELCRTPVFLRMMSEVLVRRPSVTSATALLDEFCLGMWERERAKRPLTLTDDQYFEAYEAIALAVEEEARIEPREIRDVLGLYFEEYAPELLAGLPGSGRTLIDDLAIGPLTFKNGSFSFVHEVLAAYFIARMMIRSLAAKKRVSELWNRPITETLRWFLRKVTEGAGIAHLDRATVLSDVVRPTRDGLAAWNIVQAIAAKQDGLPQDLFKGKRLAGLIFDRKDLRGMNFDGAEVFDVVFDRCDLEGMTLRGATIYRVKFIECGKGIVIDAGTRTSPDTEIVIVRSAELGAAAYVGDDARRALDELRESGRERLSLPTNLAERSLVVIFSSLFKQGLIKRDYPEWQKIENRVRGWLSEFQLTDDATKRVARVILRLATEVRDSGWITRNPNRPRTFVPSSRDEDGISRIIRTGRVQSDDRGLKRIVDECQAAIDQISEGRA